VQVVNVDGEWHYALQTQFGLMEGRLELTALDGVLRGTFVNMGSRFPITRGQLTESALSFESLLRTANGAMMLKVEATVEGDTMQGMLMTPLGDSPFSATRIS
jgi:hypothetical protein